MSLIWAVEQDGGLGGGRGWAEACGTPRNTDRNWAALGPLLGTPADLTEGEVRGRQGKEAICEA